MKWFCGRIAGDHWRHTKAPQSFEFVADLGRGEAGKLNRSALREARLSAFP
jgi:acyl-CoA synthetase (AMP-forming)/AMP-acid ligase II